MSNSSEAGRARPRRVLHSIGATRGDVPDAGDLGGKRWSLFTVWRCDVRSEINPTDGTTAVSGPWPDQRSLPNAELNSLVAERESLLGRAPLTRPHHSQGRLWSPKTSWLPIRQAYRGYDKPNSTNSRAI